MAKADRSKSAGDPLDRREFAAMFRSVYGRLWLIANGIVGDRTEAEDIVQDAAVVAIRRLEDFQRGSNFGAWLAEIVRRCAINRKRQSRRRQTFVSDPRRMDQEAEFRSLTTPITDSAGELLEHQAAFDDRTLAGLNALSEIARCCLLLRAVEQLSYAEIAELMGVPEGTAMSHVHRSKVQLRQHLKARTPPRKVGDV